MSIRRILLSLLSSQLTTNEVLLISMGEFEIFLNDGFQRSEGPTITDPKSSTFIEEISDQYASRNKANRLDKEMEAISAHSRVLLETMDQRIPTAL